MGGKGSGREHTGKPKNHGTPEAKKLYNKKKAEGVKWAHENNKCTECKRREPDGDDIFRTYRMCRPCRESIRERRASEVPDRPVDFCLECQGANFHRDGCPTQVSMISLDVRIERVLQGKLASGLVPPTHDKPAPREELTPGTVEDGRSRDEGLPESAWGETECPVPAGVKLIPPYPALRTY